MRRTLEAPAVLAVMLVSITTACASRGGELAESPACGLRSSDSVFTRAGPAYRACAVERPAERISRVAPEIVRINPRECYSAQLEFVVGPDGVPEAETARMLTSSSGEYSRAVLAALPQWKYAPALRNGEPVRQIVTEQEKGIQVQGMVAGARVVRPGPPGAGSPMLKC